MTHGAFAELAQWDEAEQALARDADTSSLAQCDQQIREMTVQRLRIWRWLKLHPEDLGAMNSLTQIQNALSRVIASRTQYEQSAASRGTGEGIPDAVLMDYVDDGE